MLRTKASSKAFQISGQKMPRVLAIAAEHYASHALLGPRAAKDLLTSDTTLQVPIGHKDLNITQSTDLKNSVFFRHSPSGDVEPCRQSISALLLIQIYNNQSDIVGVLHPEPAYSFSIKLFPNIPFLRINPWPFENNQISYEWIIDSPNEASFPHNKVIITDSELREI